MNIFTLDLEGVLIPEIWIAVAKKTGIKELERTTRDEPDYDKLMKYRIDILHKHCITLSSIQSVIGELDPLDGAKDFFDELRNDYPAIILSDTFQQFALPLIRKLGNPVLLCHELIVQNDMIVDYKLRLSDHKRKSVEALRSMNYNVIASGDSYNDLSMLRAANNAVLYKPTEKFASENSDLPVATNYQELKFYFKKLLK